MDKPRAEHLLERYGDFGVVDGDDEVLQVVVLCSEEQDLKREVSG